MNVHLIVFLQIICAFQYNLACKGCVQLDQFSFLKIVPRFKAVFVKFDSAYPYGDKHDTFSKLSEELTNNQDILLAEVPIKDYGEKDNEALGKQYGINSKEDLPQIQLFLKGKQQPVVKHLKEDEWSVDKLREILRDHSNVYIGLPGCLQQFDRLAFEFVNAKNRPIKLKDVEAILKETNENERGTATIYTVYMKRIIDGGDKFIAGEKQRLGNILKGQLNESKRRELTVRLNILHSFINKIKDEL